MKFPNLGFGLGFRPSYTQEVLADSAGVDWYEVLAENFMGLPDCGQGPTLPTLLKIREDHPIVLHCISMNIGGLDPVNENFLAQLKELIHVVEPSWVSDHLCWTGIHGLSSHELLPLPYTAEAVQKVAENIERVQDFLGRHILIENTSSYMTFDSSEMQEWEFISEIIKKTDCGLLLDVNNVYVSAQNHDFNAREFIDGIPLENVGQIHLAGHRHDDSGLIIDTHDNFICDEVFDLLRYTAEQMPIPSIMVEWDSNLPTFDQYRGELQKARSLLKNKCLSRKSQGAYET